MIDWETLQLENDSFIEYDFKTAFTDVLYRVKLKKEYGKEQVYLYALSEHQSTPDPLLAFRLWYYKCKIWDRFLKQTPKRDHNDKLKLPLILTVTFYNGQKTPYPYTMDFFELFEDSALAKELYNAPCPLIDLTVIPDEELLTHGYVATMELLHKHAYQRDFLPVIQRLIQQGLLQLLKSLDGGQHISRLVNYTLEYEEKSSDKELVDALTQALPDMKETIMSAADQLRQEGHNQGLKQGMLEGMQQGMQQGEYNKQREIAINMLKEGFGDPVVTKTTGISPEVLAKIKKELDL